MYRIEDAELHGVVVELGLDVQQRDQLAHEDIQLTLPLLLSFLAVGHSLSRKCCPPSTGIFWYKENVIIISSTTTSPYLYSRAVKSLSASLGEQAIRNIFTSSSSMAEILTFFSLA